MLVCSCAVCASIGACSHGACAHMSVHPGVYTSVFLHGPLLKQVGVCMDAACVGVCLHGREEVFTEVCLQ